MQIKMDPERDRVHQRTQGKLQTFQTDPLKHVLYQNIYNFSKRYSNR